MHTRCVPEEALDEPRLPSYILVVLVGVPIVRTVSLLLTQLLMFMNHDTVGGGLLVTFHHFLPPLPPHRLNTTAISYVKCTKN